MFLSESKRFLSILAAILLILVLCLFMVSCERDPTAVDSTGSDSSGNADDTNSDNLTVTKLVSRDSSSEWPPVTISQIIFDDDEYIYVLPAGNPIISSFNALMSDGSEISYWYSAEYLNEEILKDNNIHFLKYPRETPLEELELTGSIEIFNEGDITVRLVSTYFGQQTGIFEITNKSGNSILTELYWCGELGVLSNRWRIASWEPTVDIYDLTGDGTDEIILICPNRHGAGVYAESIKIFDSETLEEYRIEDITQTINDHLDPQKDGTTYRFSTSEPTDITIEQIVKSWDKDWDSLNEKEKNECINNLWDAPDLLMQYWFGINGGKLYSRHSVYLAAGLPVTQIIIEYIFTDGKFSYGSSYVDQSMLYNSGIISIENEEYDEGQTIYELNGYKVNFVQITDKFQQNCVFRIVFPDGRNKLVLSRWCGPLTGIGTWPPEILTADVTRDGTDDVLLKIPTGHGTSHYTENVAVIDGVTLDLIEIERIFDTFFDHIKISFDGNTYHIGTTEPIDIPLDELLRINYYNVTDDEMSSYREMFVSERLEVPDVKQFFEYKTEGNELICTTIVWFNKLRTVGLTVNTAYEFNGKEFVYARSWTSEHFDFN